MVLEHLTQIPVCKYELRAKTLGFNAGRKTLTTQALQRIHEKAVKEVLRRMLFL